MYVSFFPPRPKSSIRITTGEQRTCIYLIQVHPGVPAYVCMYVCMYVSNVYIVPYVCRCMDSTLCTLYFVLRPYVVEKTLETFARPAASPARICAANSHPPARASNHRTTHPRTHSPSSGLPNPYFPVARPPVHTCIVVPTLPNYLTNLTSRTSLHSASCSVRS